MVTNGVDRFRNAACRLLLAGGIAAVVSVSPRADTPNAERLTTLMHDLPGWSADPVSTKYDNRPETPNGPAIDTISATRHYRRGKADLDVRFLGGTGITAPALPKEQVVGTSEGSAQIKKIDGFTTLLTTSEHQIQGGETEAGTKSQLLVWLSSSGNAATLLTFTGYGVSAQDMLATAVKLDWKALAAIGTSH